MIEQSFLQQITSHPDDRAKWLPYADWLKERGDPRGEAVRLWWSLTESVTVENRRALQSRLQALVHEGVAAVNPTFTNSTGMEFVLIPPGRFRMGSPESEKGRRKNEAQVDVELTEGFWLGKYPVTHQQYKELMRKNSRETSCDNYPVESVSWHDAVEFGRKLTEMELAARRLAKDWEYRLPTEAQWEYACRAGAQTAYYFGGGKSLLVEYAWYGDNSKGITHRVGMKKPNVWGLHDMHGNVREWCRDAYANQLRGGSDPEVIRSEPADRVLRGGSWLNSAVHCRAACRDRSQPRFRDHFFIGFRLAAVRSSQ